MTLRMRFEGEVGMGIEIEALSISRYVAWKYPTFEV